MFQDSVVDSGGIRLRKVAMFIQIYKSNKCLRTRVKQETKTTEITLLDTTRWLQIEIKSATSHHLPAQLKEKGLGKTCGPTIAETNELDNGTHSRNDLHVDIYDLDTPWADSYLSRHISLYEYKRKGNLWYLYTCLYDIRCMSKKSANYLDTNTQSIHVHTYLNNKQIYRSSPTIRNPRHKARISRSRLLDRALCAWRPGCGGMLGALRVGGRSETRSTSSWGVTLLEKPPTLARKWWDSWGKVR